MPDADDPLAGVRKSTEAILRLSESLRFVECVECGASSVGKARGWRAFLTVDGDEVAIYCPECGEEAFGDA